MLGGQINKDAEGRDARHTPTTARHVGDASTKQGEDKGLQHAEAQCEAKPVPSVSRGENKERPNPDEIGEERADHKRGAAAQHLGIQVDGAFGLGHGPIVGQNRVMSAEGPKSTLRGKTRVRELYKQFKQEFDPGMEIWFLLQDWDDPYNVGGMFRVADACGAAGMVLTGKTPQPPDPQIHVTSMGHHRRIAWHHFERHDEGALFVKSKGLALVTVELAEGAVAYMDYDYPDKLCLALGNEVNGIYDSLMRHRDAAVYIPQLGKGRSMNVHVSGAVVAFHALFVGGLNQRDE